MVEHRDEVNPIARDREGTFVMCFAHRLPELHRRGRTHQARRDRRLDSEKRRSISSGDVSAASESREFGCSVGSDAGS